MKSLLTSIFLSLFFVTALPAMEAINNPTIEIKFQNIKNEKFRLVPFHQLEGQAVIGSLCQLFQDPKVYEYYENGCMKSFDDCKRIYDRVSCRFKDWDHKSLGWVAILDERDSFQGFIGANIHGNSIEVCMAVNPPLQRTRITTFALMEYLNYFWPQLEENVRNNVHKISAPINPNNSASCELAKSFYKNGLSDQRYIPSYYAHLDINKGSRVDFTMPIGQALDLAKQYQEKKEQNKLDSFLHCAN